MSTIKTYFASPERLEIDEIEDSHIAIEKHAISNLILHSKMGIILVVNKNRQIVAVSDDTLAKFDTKKIEAFLGLRPGELFNCIHSQEMKAGCGTSKSCQSCGAVLAILDCFETRKPTTHTCALTTTDGEHDNDTLFKVIATPVDIENEEYVILYFQEATKEQNWEILQQVFFHDINNLLSGLQGVSDLISISNSSRVDKDLSQKLKSITTRIVQEISFQKCLFDVENNNYEVFKEDIYVPVLITEIESIFHTEATAQGKDLKFTYNQDIIINTDSTLLNKILYNLLKNACEATPKGGEVRFGYKTDGMAITFLVHNDQVIPDSVIPVLFKKNFSTKSGNGRGIGLYSVKLFAESFLNGSIYYNTTEEKGTTFYFTLPVN